MVEGDAILLDGSTVHLRSLTPADRTALVALFDSLSPESRRRRFFTAMKNLEGPLLDRLLHVDHDDAIVIVAVRNGRIVGVGRANREPATTGTAPDRAEIAFTVADELQGHGIATLLLEALATRARLVDIAQFVAVTQSDNGAMLGVFRSAGYDASIHHDPLDPATMLISFSIAEDSASRSARRDRERQAGRASLQPLLRPRSIAVIGVSETKLTPGRRVVQELVSHGYTGRVFPVHPRAPSIEALPCFSSVAAIGQLIDLAIIAVPAPDVVDVARQCAEAGVRGIMVLSAGFAEVGVAGRARQNELLAVARDSGMRCIGPNCLGVVTTDDTVRMHAVFTELDVLPGPLALMSQSGAVAMAIASLAQQRGIGFSSLVSVGNKVDVSGNDLLEYWDQDEQTTVIALYLESFGNPRKFARLAREISRHKPIVAIKAARSDAGRRAASSHTGALAAPDATVDALFDQAGILRVEEPRELLDLCVALDRLPLPTGRRIAIVGNAGGLAILAADALTHGGLALAEFAPETVANIRSIAPPNASASNPVDLTASASSEQLADATRCLLADPDVDAVIVVHVRVVDDEHDDTRRILGELSAAATKPIVAVFGSDPDGIVGIVGSQSAVVTAPTAREAALLLGHMADRRRWLDRQEDDALEIPAAGIARIRSIISVGLLNDANDGWLPITAAFEILNLAGINVAGPVLATNGEEAAAIAAAIGFPVSVKAASPSVVHRSDVGAVRIGLRDEYNVLCAYEAIEHALGDSMGGALIQAMASSGVEMIVGISNDRHFGPLVLLGAGGRTAELWRDTALHLAPLGRGAAITMIESLRSHRLLTGFRGSEPADEAALIDALLRVAQLAAEFPEIIELDVNPLIVHPHGATAVDAKIRVAPNPTAGNDELRLLR